MNYCNIQKNVHDLIEKFVVKDDIKSLACKEILLVTKDKILENQEESEL